MASKRSSKIPALFRVNFRLGTSEAVVYPILSVNSLLNERQKSSTPMSTMPGDTGSGGARENVQTTDCLSHACPILMGNQEDDHRVCLRLKSDPSIDFVRLCRM
jgi:hypothetical protein